MHKNNQKKSAGIAGRFFSPSLKLLHSTILFIFISAYVLSAQAAETSEPAISIIIDDMGNQHTLDQRVIDLPGKVTCSFLPHATFTKKLAVQAKRKHKEVMVHMPMQPENTEKLPPYSLTVDMTRAEFRKDLFSAIASVPYVEGINNHMGSLLTRHPGSMQWLMEALKDRKGLFFVDSRTTVRTVAEEVARENSVPAIRRNVFLDDTQNRAEIRRQFKRLLKLARMHGTAVAIGHPHPDTLAVLEKEIPRLARMNIRLVSVKTLIKLQNIRRHTWQTYSSPLQKVARSSKPSL